MSKSARRLAGPHALAISIAAMGLLLWVAAGTASAQTNPPASGDWYVATNTAISGQTVTVSGDVTIPNGVTLDLTNVDLRIDSPSPGAYGVYVQAGGTLNVQGGVIQPLSPTNTYRFEIHGAAYIEGAQIQYMWGSNKTEEFGVQIYKSGQTQSSFRA